MNIIHVEKIIDYNKRTKTWFFDYVELINNELVVQEKRFLSHQEATDFYNRLVKWYLKTPEAKKPKKPVYMTI